MDIRDRIVEMRRITGKELSRNPANWRRHTARQRGALEGILKEVGVADALIAYYSLKNGGALTLIDGHLRQDVAPDHEWPVLVLDVSDAEAAKLLLTLDPLAAMAEADAQALDAALREIDTGNAALQEMFAALAEQNRLYESPEGVGAAAASADDASDADEGSSNDDVLTAVLVGEYRAFIPKDDYLRWREAVRFEVGFDDQSVKDEILRRLGL
jgi:hypothetical protein